MPGSSEHQTGLTIDVSAKSVGYRLDQSFGDTKEGKWLAKHCHEYGFIIRYPYGKEKITGYSYEPWHIRYVGISIAGYLYKNDLTLEEYYGVTMENEKVPENSVDVEDPDSVVYATPKPTKKPKEEKEDKKEKKDKKARHSAKPKKTSAPAAEPASTPAPVVTEVPPVTAAPAATEPPAPTPTEVPPATKEPVAEETSAPTDLPNE